MKQPQIEVPSFVGDEESRAYELMDAGKYLEAKDILQPLAKQDSIYALRSLGWIYHLGKLGSVDLAKASSCYRRIAELGYTNGYFELARLHYHAGEMIEARRLFSFGSEKNDMQCQAWLGRMLSRGKGGPQDIPEAFRLLQISAAKGQLLAKSELCRLRLSQERSRLGRISIYAEIMWLGVLVFVDTLRDPHSPLGYH